MGFIIVAVIIAGVIVLGGGNTISGVGADVGKITGKNEMSTGAGPATNRNVNSNTGYNGY